jgi:hypothetical protein
MKNKSIIGFATLMLFTACSPTSTLVKKKPRVNKVPAPVEILEEVIVVEAPEEPVGGDNSLPPRYYSIEKKSP